MVFQAIAELIAERNECDISEITPETTLEDLGIDSLDTVEMMLHLEDQIGVEMERDETGAPVGELVEYIERKMAE